MSIKQPEKAESNEWIIKTKDRKQLKMIRIPVRLVKKHNIKDGKPLQIKITVNDEEIFRETVKPTSEHEICLRKNTVEMLQSRNAEELKFSLL